jgi:DNA-binding NarL/FixJ family response regulator
MRPAAGNATLDGVLRCLIVDDNTSFLAAAKSLLEREGLEVVGVVSTSRDALRAAEELRPDVVLVDLVLGDESGLELAASLAAADPDVSVILISTHSEADFAELIEAAPAAGFLPKSELSADAISTLASAPRDT